MAEIIRLTPDAPANVVLTKAMEESLDRVIIIAYKDNKDEPLFIDTNIKDGGDMLWMLELAKLLLMKVIA